MTITKRTHSSPCFWLALWNVQYFERFLAGESSGSARSQTVSVLSVRADHIYETTVDNVHYDKHLGLAEIRPQDMLSFCAKYFPDQLPSLDAYLKDHPDDLLLDFENHWSALECLPPYTTVLEVAKLGHPKDEHDLGNLACFVAIQNMRSHGVLKSMIEATNDIGRPRFEHYWMLKHMLSNPDSLYRLVEPIAMAKWTFYVSDRHALPVPETPVLVRDGTILVALSPRLLAQLDLKKQNISPTWECVEGIPASIVDEYRRRCIGNTFKEILFSDRAVLSEWQASPEFARRVRLMKGRKTYNEVIASDDSREVWKINAFGNLL